MSRQVPARATALAVLLLAAVLLFPADAAAVKKLGLSSAGFTYNVAPGQTSAGEIVVIDDGDEAIKVMVYTADQKIDEKGKVEYVVPSRDVLSSLDLPSAWVRVRMPVDSKAVGNTPYLDMKVGERVPVKFDFQVPPDATPGDYNVYVFFEMFDFRPQGGASVSRVSGRIGARLKIRVQGEFIEKLEVAPFSVPKIVIGRDVGYVFRVTNGGNLDKPVSAVVELMDTDEATVVRSTAVTGTTVYAGQNYEASGRLTADRTLFGSYTTKLTVEYPKETGVKGKTTPETIVKTRQVWAFPLWFVVVVGMLALAILLWIAWRAAVRTAERRARRQRPARRPDGRGNRRGRGVGADAGMAGGPAPPPERGRVEPRVEPYDQYGETPEALLSGGAEGPGADSADRGWADGIDL